MMFTPLDVAESLSENLRKLWNISPNKGENGHTFSGELNTENVFLFSFSLGIQLIQSQTHKYFIDHFT